MSKAVFDAIVVGAGPAGTICAHDLARRGHRVLLLEKEKIPRHKVCGGGLSRKTLRALPFAVEAVTESVMRRGLVAFGQGRAIARELPEAGVMVRRDRFDEFLSREAARAGAEVRDGAPAAALADRGDRIEVEAGGRKIEALLAVAADGVHSAIRRGLRPGAPWHPLAAVEALVWPAPGVLEEVGGRCLFDFGAIEGGYGWIFPKSDHLNVGVYRYRRTSGNTDLRRALDRFIAGQPWLRQAERTETSGYLIPAAPAARALAIGRVLLAGDAAGLAEGLFGEGIANAIESGRAAAAAAAKHLERGTPLASYDRRLRGLRRRNAAARVLADLFYRAPLDTVARLARHRRINDLFAGLITGDVTPPRCIAQGILTAPIALLGPGERWIPWPPADRSEPAPEEVGGDGGNRTHA